MWNDSLEFHLCTWSNRNTISMKVFMENQPHRSKTGAEGLITILLHQHSYAIYQIIVEFLNYPWYMPIKYLTICQCPVIRNIQQWWLNKQNVQFSLCTPWTWLTDINFNVLHNDGSKYRSIDNKTKLFPAQK